jgi:hypothetical protein
MADPIILASEDEVRERLLLEVVERLSNPALQRSLAEALVFYYKDIRESITFAEVLSEGHRPEGLANEVYACFHHIARGLVEKEADSQKEIQSAKNSHLKRMGLDSHKILINRCLSEAKPVLESLDLIVGNPDISALIEGGRDTINQIRDLRTQVRQLYLQAKRAEGRGDENSIECYEAAANVAVKLLDEVQKVIATNEVLFAIKRDEELRLDRKNSLKIARESARWGKGAVIVAAVATVISILGIVFG